MIFELNIDKRAIDDIQSAIDFYDEQQLGLGLRFERELNTHLITLKKNPFFSIRYDDVHCLPLKIFPYMIHYTVDKESKSIIIRGVFHTSMNPKNWSDRKKNIE